MSAAPAKKDAVVAAQELASRLIARRRLIHFIKRLDRTYKDGWVHRDICARLEKFSDDVEKGLSPRLMILMPPRHGKSRIASQAFPAWHLGRFPHHEFIAASYNVDLAMSFSRKVQAVMQDPKYAFDTKLDPNNISAATWGLAGEAGGFIAAGVGGGITGKGAHILTIDDPIKNHEEADSQLVREGLWDWYTSTAYTRLAPGGGVLVIQTCWHDDDLAGRLQAAMQAGKDDPDVDQFEIVKYPALAEADEWVDNLTGEMTQVENPDKPVREEMCDDVRVAVLRALAPARAAPHGITPQTHKLLRIRGEPLHPQRYDYLKLMRIRTTMPVRFWSALYQQNPVPDDGSFFTRAQFRRAQLPPKAGCNVFITFDFAVTEKQSSDFTVGAVGLQDQTDLLHFADVRFLKSGDAFVIVEMICSLIRDWRTPNMRLAFENGQIFLAIEALLKKRMRELNLNVPYETLQPVTDKKVRASVLQGRMQQGRASFGLQGEWYERVKNEMLRFPSGVHDDAVDALAWMARVVQQYDAPRPPTRKELKSWKDRLRHAGVRGGTHMTA